jgi:hypothetical protein
MEVSSQIIQYNKIKIINDNNDNPIKYTIINNEQATQQVQVQEQVQEQRQVQVQEQKQEQRQDHDTYIYMLFLKNDKTNMIYKLYITKNKLEGFTGEIDIHKILWINENITISPSIYNYKLVKYNDSCNIDITSLNKQPIDLLKPDLKLDSDTKTTDSISDESSLSSGSFCLRMAPVWRGYVLFTGCSASP